MIDIYPKSSSLIRKKGSFLLFFSFKVIEIAIVWIGG